MPARNTIISIDSDAFHINGQPTYKGQSFRGMKIEGLLMNSRMVQCIFDDLNPETRSMWDYPDSPWNADRNTREFLAAMPSWREQGLTAFTINFQGGSPKGYADEQPWHNPAFRTDGSLRPEYIDRMEQILDRADELGMVAIVGYFYFAQAEHLADEAAVISATDNATDWLLDKGYTNVIIEIANEVDIERYKHDILRIDRCCELIKRVQRRSTGKITSQAGRLLVGTSLNGGVVPPDTIIKVSDFLILHGNGVSDPNRIREMVDECRAGSTYRGQPILFNEDDHFDFDADDNNMLAAVSRYAGWGYFDYRLEGEGFNEGYQTMPVDWSINSERKRGFFRLLKEMTGGK